MGRRSGHLAAGYGLAGVLTVLWAATLPATDTRLDLGPARLGLVLTVMACGALLGMAGVGGLADRGRPVSPRVVLVVTSAAVAGSAAAGSFGTLAVLGVLLGLASGALTVTLTLAAVAAERAADRPLMAALHGAWTVGAVIGGAATAAALGAGPPAAAVAAVGALAVAVLAVAAPGAPAAGARLPVAAPAAPDPPAGLVIALGALGAAAFVAEGAAVDWSGIHATRVLGADPAAAALFPTLFFAAMAAVRFGGDRIRTPPGPAATVRRGAVVAAAGHVLVLLAVPASAVGWAVAGWVLAGAGLALLWPTAASALGAASRSAGRVSAATMIGYVGGLAGPALMGAIAAHAGLGVAMALPLLLCLLVAGSGHLLETKDVR